MIKFLDLQSQYKIIKEEIDEAIANVISTSAFIGGSEVSSFEDRFAAYQNSEYCIGVANGTDALEIAIESLELPPNSEIVVPANSFIASSEAVTRSGHKVLFCDCDEDNYTISIPSLERIITPNTRAVIAVHLYGHPCDMDALREVAIKNDLKIIEDCAQAHGAEYKGNRVGALGDIGTFSFYPGKNLGAYGDAGAIVTNSEKLALKCRMIANHGRIEKYNHRFEGRNSRLDNLQAAILNVKLRHLDQWTERRIKIANLYKKELSKTPQLKLPKLEEWAKQVYHLFVIRIKDRDIIQDFLRERGIQTGIHYPIALPKLQAYSYLNLSEDAFEANHMDAELLSLPIGDHISEDQAMKVVHALREYFGE
jgi:dTDP-4-amino-4,6-dideoxygalactose transaminase